MKKILVGLLVLVMLCSAFMATALAANDEFCGYECIPIYIDGELVTLDVPALLIEETTYVPVRAFSNALGATDVFWDNGTVVITAPELTV
ncbi:MAG: copper amine oxidase N-terminal domain-containing protein, partial [Oscillospiraceae bacterium]|nr:copper amine oxidase N-terminal domain-containing protein [Oscillospiraceae bacterium]